MRHYDEPTYYAANEAMERSFWDAVGWCLQYRIPVHVKGQWRGTWDMRLDINRYREENRLDPVTGEPPQKGDMWRSEGKTYVFDGKQWVSWGAYLACEYSL